MKNRKKDTKMDTKKKEKRKKEKEKRFSGLKRCKKMVHCIIILVHDVPTWLLVVPHM